jgi:hypothetical protein
MTRAATRLLDALHLASALSFREAYHELILVSSNERLRVTAQPSGLQLSP